jgi:hypothetical protein
MKKMLIAAISAIAVIASVIGCQVYDSQKNTVLASWMDKNGSDIRIYEDFAAEFNDACNYFRDHSSDDANYNKIVDMYLGFDKVYAEALNVVNGYVATEKEAAATVEAKEEVAKKYNPKLHDVEWVKGEYKGKFFTKAYLYANVIAKIDTDKKDWTKVSVAVSGKKTDEVTVAATGAVKYNLAELYEDVYKLRWDYNSKK